MNVVIIIFIVVASLFALSTLTYLGVEIYLEVRAKRRAEQEAARAQTNRPNAPVKRVAVPEEPIVLPTPVEHIDAEEADAMISDTVAIRSARTEKGAGDGLRAAVNIGDIDAAFAPNSVVTMKELKEKLLVPNNAGRVKILADGILNKPLTVKAESFSIQAIKMIELTGGTVIILKD